MSKRTIEIIIRGEPGVGKTTIAGVIERALVEAGFSNVRYLGLGDNGAPAHEENESQRHDKQAQRLQSITGRAKEGLLAITITEATRRG